MNKKQAIEITELQFNLKLKLLDELFEAIGDLRAERFLYKDIGTKMGVSNQSALSKLINAEPSYIEGLQNKTLAKWLHNLKK